MQRQHVSEEQTRFGHAALEPTAGVRMRHEMACEVRPGRQQRFVAPSGTPPDRRSPPAAARAAWRSARRSARASPARVGPSPQLLRMSPTRTTVQATAQTTVWPPPQTVAENRSPSLCFFRLQYNAVLPWKRAEGPSQTLGAIADARRRTCATFGVRRLVAAFTLALACDASFQGLSPQQERKAMTSHRTPKAGKKAMTSHRTPKP